MSEGTGYIYSGQCMRLRDLAAQCDLKIQQTKENQQKFLTLEGQTTSYTNLKNTMTAVMAKIKPWMDSLQKYNAKKKQEALTSINSALSVASLVVPSSMKGIRLAIEGKEAWLENEDGMDVDRIEGSGYKGVVSTYLRDIILKANPSILQFIILDEPLAKLGTENSATFSTYIPLLAQGMQLIWIEHKKEVFSNLENKTVYTFFKDDRGCTQALKEEG